MPLWSRKGRKLSSHSTISFSGEPDEVKVSRPVVRPAKADVFSGRQSRRGKSQSPVAWMAGRRETDDLKPIDKAIFGMVASHRAVTKVNAEVAPKVRSPGGRARNRKGEGSMAVAGWLTRRATPAGWERRHGDKDTSSNWRSPPRPAAKAAEAR